MGKNKLIKKIKKQALKQFEADMRNAALKELYDNTSKKEIKKLKKKLDKELQEEIFGPVKSKKKDEDKKVGDDKGRRLSEKEMVQMQLLSGINVPEKVLEKHGVDKGNISSLPEGVMKAMSKTGKSLSELSKTPYPETVSIPENLLPKGFSERVKKKSEAMDDFAKSSTMPGLDSMLSKHIDDLTKESKKSIPVKTEEITPEKKEELTFFIEKLKDAVSKLRKNERNISYRKKTDGVYKFEFERKADFDLKFEFDLDMYTYGAKINVFEFRIDGFKFDKKSFDILDIATVLDRVGMNMNKYINEINGVNQIDIDKVKTPTIKKHNLDKKAKNLNNADKKKTIRANTNVETIISDSRIVSTLHKNDIAKYKDLKKFEDDFTAIKGVGKKTAEKIQKYIKG